LAGCANLGNGKIDSPISTYEAGWVFVTFDIATKPFQPEEVAEVTGAIYALAKIDYANPTGMLDVFVREEIERLYPDSTPAFHDAMFGLYTMGKLRIQFEIKKNPDIPRLEILDEFKRGVNDALLMYETTEQPAEEDLTSILEAMEE
jgi:hypothetical protein